MKAETGRTDSGGRLKSFTWTKADGGQTLSVCPKDGFGRRTVKVFFKADGNGRRTDPFGPPQGRIRTSDAKKILKADGALSSASRTDSDVEPI